MNGSSFFLVAKVPRALFIFFSLSSSCRSGQVIPIVLSSRLLILSSACSILLLGPFIEFKFQLLCFSVLTFLFGSSLHLLFLC